MLTTNLWPLANSVSNPIFATATGGSISGCTGTVPSSWQVARTVGTPTCVAGTVSNATTGGHSLTITVTSGGANAIQTIRLTPTANITAPAAFQNAWVSAFAEVDLDAGGFWAVPYLAANDPVTTSHQSTALTNVNGTQTTAILGRGVAHKYWLKTPAMLMTGSVSSIGLQIYFQMDDLGVTGATGTATIDRVWLGVEGFPGGRLNHCNITGATPC